MSFDAVIKRARRRPLYAVAASTREVSIGRVDIERMLPHREPFLLVDRVTRIDLQQEALTAERTISPDDPVFRGHFPGAPVYPGALQVEAMGQASLCCHHLLEAQRDHVAVDDTPRPLRLLRVHHALFLAEARPGDRLTLHAQRLESDSYTVICAAQVMREDTICAASVMEVYLIEEE